MNVTDDNALKGLSMLLEGIAASWWKGIKSHTTTWDTAVKSLSDAYSRKLPPYLIFRELFVREQREDEKTELFVCHARAQISQLPYKVLDQMQLDMVYGLLYRNIRKRVTRNDFNTFQSLLDRTRDVELSQREVSQVFRVQQQKTPKQDDKRQRPRCTYCKNFGHIESECRKLHDKSAETFVTTRSTTEKIKPSADMKPKSQITCFGCGNPGFIRSNCPNCASKKHTETITNANSSFSFNAQTASIQPQVNRPMISVQIHGLTGLACIDTGSNGSLAGAQLYNILTNLQVPFTKTTLEMKFADGKARLVQAKLFNVIITVTGRKIPTTLIAIPEHSDAKMLLGVDFLRKANIILNIPKGEWFFADTPQNSYKFLSEQAKVTISTDSVQATELNLRDNEGVRLNPELNEQINSLFSAYSDIFPERAALLQGEPNEENPIRYASRLLTDANILTKARENCEEQQQHAKKYADQKRRPGESFEVGDKVLVDIHALSQAQQFYTAKFAPRRDGPYVICKQISPSTYQIASLNSPDTPIGVYHTSSIIKFIDRSGVPDPEPIRPLRKRGRPRIATTSPVHRPR